VKNYIEFKNVGKTFPGHVALDDVSFSIARGEVHAIVGENGAGKSTLLNIFHGIYAASRGEIHIDGNRTHFREAVDAIRAGIAKVHQEISLVPEMTVTQNLFLGNEVEAGVFLDRSMMIRETQRVLDQLGCTFKPIDQVKTLNIGEKQMLQIAKALHMNAKIISFDEPTSSLSRKEVNALFAVIRELNGRGITIIYVSHKLDEIYDLCNRATILRDGAFVGSYDLAALPKEELIRKMVGRDVAMFAKRHKPSSPATDEVVLSVDGLEGETGFRDVSFSLKKGEILGFFGLVGAKRTEVMRAIFGADPVTHGVVRLHGNKIRNQAPCDAVANGIALIPENRKEQGFVKDLNNLDNVSLASLKRYERFVFQNDVMKRHNAQHKGAQVRLTPNDPAFMTASLSGGNQQKVILAKWLSTSADVFIFDEPTKGIDVGSKAEIYALMEELLENGKSIIMVSSELPEIIGISDRILVMNTGRIVAELQRSEFREDRILAHAVGEKSS
jgi:ABC-type sugar transport system ATPase subunit